MSITEHHTCVNREKKYMFLLFKALKHSQTIPTYFGPCEEVPHTWIIQESVKFCGDR